MDPSTPQRSDSDGGMAGPPVGLEETLNSFSPVCTIRNLEGAETMDEQKDHL